MIRVIRHHAPVGVLPLLLSEIVILLACFYASAAILYPDYAWYYLTYEGGASLVAAAIGTIILTMYFFDLYADVQPGSRIALLQQLCQSLGAAILLQTVAAYILRDWTVPQLMMLYSTAFALVALFGWRLLFAQVILRIGPIGKLLFLGHSATSDAVAAAIDADPKSGNQVIGFLDDNTTTQTGDRLLGPVSSLRQVVAEHKPNLLVVGLPERRAVMPVADLVALRFGGLQIEEASKTYESVYKRVRLQDLSEQQVMFSRTFAPSLNALALSRVTSVLLALASAPASLPICALLALWLRLNSSGPVLIRLPREGKDGHLFPMLRFRRDPSLRWLLERFHLDALPELWNVLRGEMSLVGPSAEAPEFAAEYRATLPFYHYRTAVPPGVTGWAKIHESPQNSHNRALALQYDLYYIKHMSQALNAYILVHSLKNRILRP